MSEDVIDIEELGSDDARRTHARRGEAKAVCPRSGSAWRSTTSSAA